MATRQAAIRLTLNSSSFQAEMRSLTGRAAASGRMMGRAMSAPLSAGLNSAKRSLADFGSSLKTTIKSYGTLAGTIATGLLTKNALELQGVYRNLAFDVAKLNGEAMTWQDVQKDVDTATEATGQRARDMANAFGDVYRATGDLDFTRQTLEAIGTAATASGEETSNYATAAQMMMRKFDIAARDVPDAMAAITQQVNSGALGLDGLNNRFGMLAGEAKEAGMTGVGGMTELLGLFRQLDSNLGEKLTPALTLMFQTMKSGSTYAKAFGKVGVDFKPDESFREKFKKLLSGKGRILAEATFTGASRTAFDLLAKPFDKALKEAQEKGLKKAAAVDTALKAIDEAFHEASKTTWDYAELQRRAQKRMADDPSVKMRMALNRLERAFSQPKMINAIEKLADKLPILADKLADFVDWAVDNPWKAVGAVAGAKVAGPAIGAAAGTAGAMALKSIGAKLVGGAAAGAGAGTAATGAAGAATGAAGTSAGGIALGLTAGTATAISAGAAIGGTLGYVGYKAAIEPLIEKRLEELRGVDEFLMTADEIMRRKRISRAGLMAALSKTREMQSEKAPGGFQSYLAHTAKFYGANIDSAEKQRADRLGKLADAEARLIERIRQMDRAMQNASGSVYKLGDTAANTTPASQTPGSSRGVKEPDNNWPGSIPVGG
jgi:hypothetical protein